MANKGFFYWINQQFFGRDTMECVFPEISDDPNEATERHTTAVGIDPTKVLGSRFIINIRIPSVPPNLFEVANSRTCTDMEDEANYDEWEENWQYLRVKIDGVFNYRLRLPKGLQFRKFPEIQIEIPAVEQRLKNKQRSKAESKNQNPKPPEKSPLILGP